MYDREMLVRERMSEQFRHADAARLSRLLVTEPVYRRGSPPRRRLNEPCSGEFRPADRPA